jgi:hypothetical protein
MELSRAELLQEEISNVTLSQGRCKFPTVATEAVLLSCVAAEEGRDVKVIDIRTPSSDEVEDEKDMAVIKIRGVLVDMLVKDCT